MQVNGGGSVWEILSTVFSGITLAGVATLSYTYGKLVQKVSDIDVKGCQRVRNGVCKTNGGAS